MKVDIMRPSLRYPFDIPAMKRLEGQSVKSIGRRGKIIIIELSQNYLLIHLGMTGHLVLYDSELPIRKHMIMFYFLYRMDMSCDTMMCAGLDIWR